MPRNIKDGTNCNFIFHSPIDELSTYPHYYLKDFFLFFLSFFVVSFARNFEKFGRTF